MVIKGAFSKALKHSDKEFRIPHDSDKPEAMVSHHWIFRQVSDLTAKHLGRPVDGLCLGFVDVIPNCSYI